MDPSCGKYSEERKQETLPPASPATVYATVVRPALEYAAPLWQNIPDFLSYKIVSIQKRAMRIIFPLMNYNEALNALNKHYVRGAPTFARSKSIDSGMRTPLAPSAPQVRGVCT